MKNIKHYAFWPAFILLGGALVLQFVNPDAFFAVFSAASSFFMEKMAWFAILVTILCLIVCIWAAVSKFGNVRIGGKNAKPKLSTFSWFSIALTSSLASGLLVWGPAEPLYHIQDPAMDITGIEPFSADAYLFASETMYMHWSFLPYAIMTTSAIVFAFMYYNAKRPYSVISELAPILRGHEKGRGADIIDGIILFCVTIAIAASLGQMLLNITYGVSYTMGIQVSTVVMLIITVIVVIISVGTAISGLNKGIKFLADFNTYGYFILLAAILIGGGTFYILNLGTEGLGSFATHLFDRSMMTGAAADSLWPSWWTTFYWASYYAWTPTLGLFMGSISYGRKIKDLIFVNIIGCGGFGAIWVMIISGSSLERQQSGIVDLVGILNKDGLGAVPYKMLESLPLGAILAILYLVILIISFITCANANISVMAGLATKNTTLDDPTGAPAAQKLIWGVITSGIAFVVVSAIGIDGVKQLANVSGLLAIFIEVGIIASIVVLIKNWRKFDETGTYLKEDPNDDLA